MEKLHSYQGWIGRFHEWRESFRERFQNWRQENPETVIELLKNKIYNESSTQTDADYSHLYRFINNFFSFKTYHQFDIHFNSLMIFLFFKLIFLTNSK